MALKQEQSYKLRALKSRQKKVQNVIAELQKMWPAAIDRAFVERHIAQNVGTLTQIESEIKHLESLQTQTWR
ncbi:MAG: hypothetical protein ACI351_01870 [Candidatus Avelusimicrobium sp.]|uniref:hypothetical protein n=1 Tax=Candidatus Avelusimicrobium sp. TaxID=3048833 RepID=UPI003F0F0073